MILNKKRFMENKDPEKSKSPKKEDKMTWEELENANT